MKGPVPGAESVRCLTIALEEHFGPHVVRWDGPIYDDEIDAVGWRLSTSPRLLFSVSTHAGQLTDGWYDVQVSIIDDSLENGDILFLDELSLVEVIDLASRFHRGEIVEHY